MNSGFIELTIPNEFSVKIRVAIDKIIMFRPYFDTEDGKEFGTAIYMDYNNSHILYVEESYIEVAKRINRALDKVREVCK